MIGVISVGLNVEPIDIATAYTQLKGYYGRTLFWDAFQS